MRGTKLYRGLITAANERHAAFLAVFSEGEREVFGRALDKLADLALAMERAERDRSFSSCVDAINTRL